MYRICKCCFLFCVVIVCFIIFSKPVYGQSMEEDNLVREYYDNYMENDEVKAVDNNLWQIEAAYGYHNEISFQKIISLLLNGNVNAALDSALEGVSATFFDQIENNSGVLKRIIMLTIMAAVFHNYSSVFRNSIVGEQGFYVTYLMIAILLMQSFRLMYEIGLQTITYVKEIMICMLPALCLSVVLCSGVTSSQMVNTMFVGMLSVIEQILLYFILPGIRIYFYIMVLNQLDSKDRFSKFGDLIKRGLLWGIRIIEVSVVGFNGVKALLIPVYENAKYGAIKKGLSMLPGGASLTGLSAILLGAALLIKNCVGVAMVFILLTIGVVPIGKLLVFYISYRVLVAMLQPISDKRILKGITSAADSAGIMVKAVGMSLVMCILSIAIIIITTNVRAYSG